MRRRALAVIGALLLLAAPLVAVEAGWAMVQAEVEARASVEDRSWAPTSRALIGVERPGVRIERLTWEPRSPRRLVATGVRVDVEGLSGGDGEPPQSGGPEVEVLLEDLDLYMGEQLLAGGFSGRLGEVLQNPEGASLGPGQTLEMTLPFPHEAVRGELHLRVDGQARTLEASGTWTLKHPLLSSRSVRLPAAALHLEGDPREQASGTLTLGAVVIAVQVDGPLVSLTLEPHDALDVLEVVEDMLPELEHAEVRGLLGGRASFNRESGAWTAEPLVDGLAVEGAVKNLEALRWGRFAYRAFDADGDPVVRQSGEGTADWTSLREVSEHLPAAVIAAEDSRFLSHPGYDLRSIEAAIQANQQADGVVRGGSTLTQQLAKNLFLDGERTLERKLRELLLAVELDRSLGKDRVMELYINVVEWGPEIWGIHQACDAYFARRPATLPPNEAAFLAAILPAPRDFYSRWYLRGRAGSFKMDWVLTNMADGKHFSHAEAQRQKARPLRFVPPP